VTEGLLPKPSSPDRSSAFLTFQAVGMASNISSQQSKLSFRSSQSQQSQSIPDPRKNTPRTSAATRKVDIPQELSDMSTQSHNTTPLKPAGQRPSDILLEANHVDMQYEARSPEEIQDVIRHIQKSPSQHCPTSISAPSTQSDNRQGSETDDHNEEGAGSILEPALARRLVPHSSGPHSSFQPSVEEKGANMDGDVLAEPAIMDQPEPANPFQHKLQETIFHVEKTEMEPELEATAVPCEIPASTAQDSSFDVAHWQDARAGMDSSRRMLEIPGDEISANGAPGDHGRIKQVGPKVDGAFVGHLLGSNEARDFASETSWEGCGPQSPWAAEHLEALPITHPEGRIQDVWHSAASVIDDFDRKDDALEKNFQSEQQDWHHLERPQTPQNDVIKPFADLMSPTPALEVTVSRSAGNGLPSTQSLATAAMDNPWTSNLRNPSSKKSKTKRVSFGVLPSEEKGNPHPAHFDNLDPSKRRAISPPPPQQDSDNSDKDLLADGTTRSYQFGGHFVAAGQFRRLLPQNQKSPLNSSPAFGAQAEAFIAADRAASATPRQLTHSPKSSSQRFKPGRDRIEEESWSRDTSVRSFQTSPKVTKAGLNNLMASFDMEDALGDVGDFLEDWSVDAELKKAKEGPGSRRESTGYRRRKLFGLV